MKTPPAQAQHSPLPWSFNGDGWIHGAMIKGEANFVGEVSRADSRLIVTAVNAYAANQETIRELVEAAKEVMDDLEKFGPSIVPHLMDTDENAGQRLREAITRATEEDK